MFPVLSALSGAGCGFSCNLLCLPSHPASAADVCGVFGGVPQPGRAGRVSVFSRLPQEVSLNSDEEAPFQLVQRVVFLNFSNSDMIMEIFGVDIAISINQLKKKSDTKI